MNRINVESKFESIKNEIEKENCVRAAELALSAGLRDREINEIRLKALRQMAVINRNAIGTKILANRYGFSKDEVRIIFLDYAEKIREKGNVKPLGVCYD